MQRIDALLRWMGAVGITLSPFGIFVLPTVMHPEPYATGEEQFRAMVEKDDAGLYVAQLSQVAGSVFLLVAALAIGGYVIARGRGRTLGLIGLITGTVTAIAVLMVMGFELAGLTILTSTTDTDAAVSLMVDLAAAPAFVIPLMIGLVGFYLTLLLLALALWRTKLVPIIVPLLFALPLLIGFVPLPIDAAVASGVLLMVPCIWMAVRLVFTRGPADQPGARLETARVPGEMEERPAAGRTP